MKLFKAVELTCPVYGHSYKRYVWGADVPVCQLGQTLKNNCYYSHHTALYFHGLTDQKSRTLYINAEQSIKPRGMSSLSQSNIDRAFQSRGRTAKYIFEYEDWKICILSGMNTGNLGAETLSTPEGNLLVANLERTLKGMENILSEEFIIFLRRPSHVCKKTRSEGVWIIRV